MGPTEQVTYREQRRAGVISVQGDEGGHESVPVQSAQYRVEPEDGSAPLAHFEEKNLDRNGLTTRRAHRLSMGARGEVSRVRGRAEQPSRHNHIPW